MTFIPETSGTTSAGNSTDSLATTAYCDHSGTAQAGSKTSVTLASGASATDDIYNNKLIEFLDGTGVNQTGIITDYNGTTKVATVNLDTVPDTTSEYVIHTNSGICQEQNITNQKYRIKIGSNASSSDDYYKNVYIKFYNGGSSESYLYRIQSYDGTNKIATIEDKLHRFIDSTFKYAIFGEGGTAASGTSTTVVLQDHGHSSTDDHFNGLIIEIVSGTGAGQTRTITDYVGATRTCTVAEWDTPPDETSVYVIFGGYAGALELVEKYSQISLIIDIGLKENCIINNHLSINSSGLNRKEKAILHTNKFPSNLHSINVSIKYYRLVLISLGTSLNGKIQVIYHPSKSGQPVSSLTDELNSQRDCTVTRSVIAGASSNNIFTNVGITADGNLKTAISEPLTGFGEVLTVQPYPVSQILFTYDLTGVVVDTDPGTQIYVNTTGDTGVAHVNGIYLMDGSQYTSSGAGDYFTLYGGDGTGYYVWIDVSNGNSDPAPTGYTIDDGQGGGIEVDITDADSSSTVAEAVADAVDLIEEFSAAVVLGNIVEITNATTGAVSQTIRYGTMPAATKSAASHDPSTSTLNITHGDGIGVYCSVRGERVCKYRAGQSVLSRFTAVFDNGTAGTGQLAGIGNQVSGYFFGYNGEQFGILHRSKGQPEIRRLTITVGASSASTCVVTLDGVEFLVSVDNSEDNAQETAYDISVFSGFVHGNWYLDVGTDSSGFAYIDFLSTTASVARSKTYSFSAGSTGIVASFSQISAGSAVVNTWIPQYEWNVNRFLGEGGTTDIVLNPQTGNVFQIQFQWLGFGNINFYIMNNENGLFERVHRIKYTGSSIEPSMMMPYMRSLYAVYTTGVTTSLTMKAVSAAIFSEGVYRRFDSIYSHDASTTTTGSLEEHHVTYRNLRVYRTKGNNTEVILETLALTNDGGKSCTVRLSRGVTLAKTKYTSVNHNKSSVVQTTDTTTTDFSTGTVIASIQIGGGESLIYDFRKYDVVLHLNETITITVKRNTTTNVELVTSLTWNEDR